MRWRKPLVWFAGIVGAAVLLVALVVASAPLWFDSEGVKTRITELLAKATGGRTQFERIDLHFVPLPGATVTMPRFSLPGLLEMDAQSASIDLDLLALLKARIRLSTITIVAPRITVQIPEPEPNEEPRSIESIEQALRETFAQIAERAPEIQINVEDGSVSLLASGRQPLSFDDVQLEAEVDDDQIKATVSCSSSLWSHLTLKMSLNDIDLIGNGTVDVVGLQVHDLGQALGRDEAWPISEAIVDASVQWQMKGLADIQAEGNLSASKITIKSGERNLDLLRPTIDVSVQWRDGASEISVRQLVLDDPRLEATAKLTRSRAGRFVLRANATNADLSALQAAAANLAPDVELLAHPPLQLKQGTITTLQVSSEAGTLAGLVRSETLQVQLELADLDALTPKFDIRIREAGASVSLVAGELEIHNATARIGKSLLSNGNASASLRTLLAQPTDEPDGQGAGPGAEPGAESAEPMEHGTQNIWQRLALSADANISLDLAEGLAIAKRVAGGSKFRRQFDQITQLTGRADFRAGMTMNSEHPEVRFDISEVQTTAHHAKVPFPIPIHLTRGGFRYVDDAIYAQDLDGAIGKSTFKDVGARIGIKAPNALGASKGSARLALHELMRWAAALPGLSKHLADIEKVTGTMSVSISKLAGTLRSPDKLQYVLTASPQRVSITAPKLGPHVKLDGGVIDISNTRIRMHEVKLSALDASVRIGGTANDYRNGLTNIEARIDGFAGLEFLEWLHMRAGLPETVRLRNPLQISRLDTKWRRDRELAARGKLQVNNGPAIGFAMRFSPGHIDVEHVSLRDEFSDASAGGELEGSRFDVRFKGKLVQRSIASIFERQPYEFSELSGDIRATGDWKHPDRTAVGGVLQGTMVGIPYRFLFMAPVPVTLENFSLEGQDQTLLIKTATVAVGDSRLHVSGSFGVSGDQYLLDADLSSDHFVVPLPSSKSRPNLKSVPDGDAIENTEAALDRMTVTGETQLSNIESVLDRLPGSGQIRINIAKLQIGRRELTPFIAAVSLRDQRLVLKLRQARLCNILLTGGMDAVMHGHANLNVEVHTRDASIERSIACLTNRNILLTGLMDVDAKFVASGTGPEFLDSLRVTFTLAARDGEIRKFDALDEVIDAVNETEAGDGKLPSTKTSNPKYTVISAKGSADLRTLRFNEIVVELEQGKIVAQGSVDIPTGTISATVLVAPLKGIDKIISRLPILGRIFGGSILAVPVGVSGTIKEPVVLPLAPGAVAGRLVDILTNTLKLPADLLNPTSPDSNKSSPPASTSTSGR